MDIKVKLTGAKEIDEVLRGLPLQVNHKILQQAHTSAARVLVNTAKLTAPEGPTGHTVDSIGTIKVPVSKATELGLVHTGPRRGRYKGNKAHFSEHGTKARFNKSGAYRGAVTGQHWMEKAWDQTEGKVMSLINGFVGKHLWNFMRKTIKNG